LIITYDPTLEAYRANAVKGLIGSYPQPGGGLVNIFGPAALAAAAPGAGINGTGGPSTALWVAIGVAVLLLVGGAWITRRRRVREAQQLEA
jgi:LPXTG-motif cell wall-anchored protein